MLVGEFMAGINIIIQAIINFIWTQGPKVVYSIIVLVLGFWIIKYLEKIINKHMIKRKVDLSLRHFMGNLVSITLKVLLLISVASMLGIATTSFVAILGAAGLAVGLALQGSLANFAGGVLLLLFRPFKVGDYISGQGYDGTVKKIEIFNTTLITPDNKTIIIPNGALSNGAITNYSKEDDRRVDLTFGIGYEDDIKKAQKIILEIIKKDKRIFKDPKPFVQVGELGDSSVNFVVRVWAKKEDYWDIHFDMITNVKVAFDKNKISIPFPQTDVHLYKGK